MRKTLGIVVFAAIMLSPAIVAGQENTGGLKPTSFTLGSGETAISSGLEANFRLDSAASGLEVTAQQDQAWAIYGAKLKLGNRVKAFVAASAGHQQSAPWAGPFITMEAAIGHLGNQVVKVSMTQWPCFFIGPEPKGWLSGNDGKPENTQTAKYGYYADVSAAIGPLQLSYARLRFLDDPVNWMPGVALTKRVGKNLSVRGSITLNQNATNRNHTHLMYYAGAKYIFGQQ